MKKHILFLFLFPVISDASAQLVSKSTNEVYNRIYTAMSNGSITKPKLIIVDDLKSESKEVATYSPINKTITIGKSFIELTRKFGIDSSNAMAHVLSHELAHVFLSHGFASVIGTGFASKEMNKQYKKMKEDLEGKMGESEADQWALFYAYISGYNTNQLVPRLLDSIYVYYNLNDFNLSKYPKLSERKKYAHQASVKMKSMCESFDFANLALIHGDFKLAIEIYSLICNEGFKSREILSNLGTANLLYALSQIGYPEINYILPLQIDMDTRLRVSGERGLSFSEDEQELINKAIIYFKQAISIDPKYGKAYLNLSIAHWLKNDENDFKYYLSKAKEISSNDEQKKIEVFEAIVKIKSNDEIQKKSGMLQLENLASQGMTLATANLRLVTSKINATSPENTPLVITEILKIKTPQFDFQNAKSILDSTFSKDEYKLLTCKETIDKNIIRKWRYRNDDESHTAIQYILKGRNQFIINESDKQILYITSKSIFTGLDKTYLCYDDIILIIDSNNNVEFQIINSL